jgi:hypothetical protein
MSVKQTPFFECSKCDFTTQQTQYEVGDEIWCEDCYTKTNYPDVWEQQQSNKKWVERCEKDDCDLCGHPNDELENLECNHNYCMDCFEDINKFNKCPECYEVINEDNEPNKEICNSCHREMDDCICYYKKHLEQNDLLYNALFINNMKNVNHKVIRKIIDMFESDYGYKDFNPDECSVDCIKIENEYDNCYVVSVPNRKYKSDKPTTYNNSEFSRVRIEFYTQDELDERTLEYVKENIHYFNRGVIYSNLKPNIYKEIIEYESDEEEDEPEKVFENESCPVCMEDYDTENTIKKIACCGHMTCMGCYTHITHSNNSRCPTCREVWDDATNENETEYIEWDEEDINELCENEDYETLNEIINVRGLTDDAIMADGFAHTLGYEDCDSYDDTRFKNESTENLMILVGEY